MPHHSFTEKTFTGTIAETISRFCAGMLLGVALLGSLLFEGNVIAQTVRPPLNIPANQPFGTAFQRKNIHNANRVKTVYFNSGLVGGGTDLDPKCAWPVEQNTYIADLNIFALIEKAFPDTFVNVVSAGNSTTGTRLRDGKTNVPIAFGSITGNFTLPDGRAAVAVSDTSVYATSHQTPRNNTKGPPGGGDFWGITPYGGFLNPLQDGAAQSDKPDTWPSRWPDQPTWFTGDRADWNGYFGRGIFNADQESYFAATDAQDKQWFSDYGYLPDPNNPARFGAGLDITGRGLQFSTFLAQDNIFWLYEVKNTSRFNYDKVLFGSIVGTRIALTDDGRTVFDQSASITYSFQPPGRAAGQTFVGTPGYVGLAFLESPGNPYDGIDNDDDYLQTGTNATAAPAQFKTTTGSGPYDYQEVLRSNGTPAFLFRRTLQQGETVIVIERTEQDIAVYGTKVSVYLRRALKVPASDTTVVSLGKAYLIGPGKVLTEISNNQQDDNLNGISDEDYGLHANRRQSKVDLVSGAISEIVLPPVHYVDYIALAAANPTGIPASVAAGSLAFDPLVINQTLYPMIDERRDDGTDNNGNEDGDGRALDATDVRESDQIGLTSFAIGTNGSFQLNLNNIRSEFYARSIPGTFDATTNQIPSSDYMYGTGYFPLAAGQTERFSIALVYGTSAQDVLDNKDIVQQIYDANYNFVRPPTPPTLKVSTDDRRVTLYWDTVAEDYRDEFIRRRLDLPANTNDPRVRNFEGYKILRSTDNNFLDAFTLVGSEGQQGIQPKPVATFDLVNEVSGNFPLNTASLLKQSKGIAYYLGNNSGLQHRFTDTTVVNGKTYFYAVIAYSRGDTGLQIYPPYNSASARSDGRGNYTLGSNVVVVTPAAKTAGYANAAGRQGNLTPAGGPGGQALPVGQGGVSYAVVDAKNLQNKTYRVEFSDIGSDTVDNDGNGKTDGNDLGERVPLTSFYRVLDVTNPARIDTLIRRNRRPLFTAGSYTELAPNLFGYNGDDEIFDGLYLSLQNELKSIYLPEKSGWTRGSGTDTINAYTVSMKPADSIAFNVVRAVVDSIPIPDDFEIELVETDAATGVAKSDTMKYLQRRTNAVQPPLVLTANGLPVNFRIKNLTTGKPVRFLVLPQATTGGGGVVIGSNTFNIIKICLSANSAVPASGIDTVYSWLLTFAPTSAANRVAPRAGDKFTFRTSKPFRTGDAFTFTTAVPDVSSERAKSVLDRIRVVPNPYIARSAFEPALPAGTTSGRGERRVYFTRVPKESTIRIYSVRGDLIRTLKQDGTDNGQVLWDLRSSEGLDIAFGLYLYHLDAPGVGTTTGKLVLIK